MNSTIRTIIIAAPLATIALTLVPSAATAEVPGPVIIVQPVEPDQPKGPQDKAPVPQPEKPKGPQDKAPVPQDDEPENPDLPLGDAPDEDPKPNFDGPDSITNPDPCPTHGSCGPGQDTPGEDTPKDEPGDGSQGHSTNSATDASLPVDLPTRIDAGVASSDENGVEIAWLLAGGALVTASGVAFAARRMRRA